MNDAVDVHTVHQLFAAQHEAYEAALRLGEQSRRDYDERSRDLARRAFQEACAERDQLARRLADAEFLIARLLDHAGGCVVLSDFVWAFGLCPKPRIVTMPVLANGGGLLAALYDQRGEPWPPKEPPR